MSYQAEISKLTLDAGARRLAQIVDAMQAQVDACCGGSIAAKEAATEKPDPPATGSAAKTKTR